MKILIFSDTHLTHRFDNAKYLYLKKIISQADKVIINGDFWDSYWTNFDKFIKSRWKKLFSHLLSKKTVYIFGNHDRRIDSDERVKLFSSFQADKIEIRLGASRLFIEHGHEIHISYNSLPRCLLRMIILPFKAIRFIATVLFKYKAVKLFSFMNIPFVRWTRRNLSEDEILIVGHSHVPKMDSENRFINTGFIRYKLAQYLILDNRHIRMIMEKY